MTTIWYVSLREKSLVEQATKLAGVSEWRGPPRPNRGFWQPEDERQAKNYVWLSNDEFFSPVYTGTTPYGVRFNVTTRQRVGAQLSPLFVPPGPWAPPIVNSVESALGLPGGGHFLWARGVELQPDIPTRLLRVQRVDYGYQAADVTWQPARQARGAIVEWKELCRFFDGWHRLSYDPSGSGAITHTLIGNRIGTMRAEPYRVGPFDHSGVFRPLGLSPDGTAVLAGKELFSPQKAGIALVGGPSRLPGPALVKVSFPGGCETLSISLSPDGERLAWLMLQQSHGRFNDWLHRRFSSLFGPPRIDHDIWISRWDGAKPRRLGYIPLKPVKKPNLGSANEDVFGVKWMPDSKRVSFIYENVLYAIDAGL